VLRAMPAVTLSIARGGVFGEVRNLFWYRETRHNKCSSSGKIIHSAHKSDTMPPKKKKAAASAGPVAVPATASSSGIAPKASVQKAVSLLKVYQDKANTFCQTGEIEKDGQPKETIAEVKPKRTRAPKAVAKAVPSAPPGDEVWKSFRSYQGESNSSRHLPHYSSHFTGGRVSQIL
jgi:hypothetical protein